MNSNFFRKKNRLKFGLGLCFFCFLGRNILCSSMARFQKAHFRIIVLREVGTCFILTLIMVDWLLVAQCPAANITCILGNKFSNIKTKRKWFEL